MPIMANPSATGHFRLHAIMFKSSMPERLRLDSWKQIAAYLGRSERTVRRWQQTEGLPVHKHLHQLRGSVWAFSDEIDAWLAERRLSPEPPPLTSPPPPSPSRWWLLAPLAIILSVIAIASWITPRPLQLSTADPTPLTTLPGSAIGGALSPDGRQLAFHWANDSEPGLYRKLLTSPTPIPLALRGPNRDFVYGPAWSPDGQTVAFLRRFTPKGPSWGAASLAAETSLCLISTQPAATERCLLPLARSTVFFANHNQLSWHPSGDRILAPMALPGQPHGIFWIFLDGRPPQRLVSSPDSIFGPQLAPDGRSFLYLTNSGPPQFPIQSIYQQPLDSQSNPTGEPTLLFSERASLSGVAWLPSSRELLLCLADQSFFGPFNSRLFTLPLGKSPLPLPSNLSNCSSLTVHSPPSGPLQILTSSGERMAASLFQSPLPPTADPTPLLPSTRLDAAPVHSPDGRHLAWLSTRDGEPALWLATTSGAQLRKLSPPGRVLSQPAWSPDSQRLAVAIAPPASLQTTLHVLPLSGGAPAALPLPTNLSPADPFWSHDGQHLYFFDADHHLWRSTATGRDAQRLLHLPQRWPAALAAPDALYIVRRGQPFQLLRYSLPHLTPSVVADSLAAPFFTSTRDSLFFFTGVDFQLLRLPLTTPSTPTPFGHPFLPLRRRHLLGFSLSPDASHLVYSVAAPQRLDIVQLLASPH